MRMTEMLEIEFPFRMKAISTSMTRPGGNSCLDIGVDLKIDLIEDEDDIEMHLKNSSI